MGTTPRRDVAASRRSCVLMSLAYVVTACLFTFLLLGDDHLLPVQSSPLPPDPFSLGAEYPSYDVEDGCKPSLTTPQGSYPCMASSVAMAAMQPICVPGSSNHSSTVPPSSSSFLSLTVSFVPGVGHVFINSTDCEGYRSASGSLGSFINATRGVVIIPEEGVDPMAYAPYARAAAITGCFAVIVSRRSEANILRAMTIFPFPIAWALMGHGRGGTLAAYLTRALQQQVTTLILSAAALPLDIDFSQANLDIVLNYGLFDDIVPPSKVWESFDRLPGDVGSNPFPRKGHYDFAYSTCCNNSILQNATCEGGNGTGGSSTVRETMIVGEDVVALQRLPVRIYQATARALSFGDNTLLRPGRNESKVYPRGGRPVEQITLSLPAPGEMSSEFSELEKPRRKMWVFKSNDTRGGFIYFPGSFVDARAYFPLAFQIATRGYMVVIPQVSRRLPIEPFVAEDILRSAARNKSILSTVQEGKWAVGGHSLGGLCAFNYAASPTRHRLAALVMHSGGFANLRMVTMRAGPSTNMTLSPLPVTNIYGTLDGLFGSDPDRYRYQAIEPPPRGFGLVVNKTATTFIAVKGADHHQVGDYSYQLGSRIGLLGYKQQQRIYAELTVKQLDKAMGHT